MTEAQADGAAAMRGNAWGAAMGFGIVTALFGVAIMAWPDLTLGILVFLLGLQLIVVGIMDLVGALAAGKEAGGMRWLVATMGVVALGVGAWILFGGESLGESLTDSVMLLGVILGIFWMLHGAVDIVSGLADSEATNRTWRLVGGALAVVAGLVVIAWPGKSLLVLTWIMGLWLLALGLIFVVAAFALKGSAKSG